MLIQPVVLLGGSGTRLWPLSREKIPKQLLPLMGEDPLPPGPTWPRRWWCVVRNTVLSLPSSCAYRASRHHCADVFGENMALGLNCSMIDATKSGANLVMPADHNVTKRGKRGSAHYLGAGSGRRTRRPAKGQSHLSGIRLGLSGCRAGFQHPHRAL